MVSDAHNQQWNVMWFSWTFIYTYVTMATHSSYNVHIQKITIWNWPSHFEFLLFFYIVSKCYATFAKCSMSWAEQLAKHILTVIAAMGKGYLSQLTCCHGNNYKYKIEFSKHFHYQFVNILTWKHVYEVVQTSRYLCSTFHWDSFWI